MEEMMKELQEMSDKIEVASVEAREHKEEAKQRESLLLELIRKLEEDEDKMKRELDDNSQAGNDKQTWRHCSKNFTNKRRNTVSFSIK
ncbi:hypothetical protein ACJMK2_016472 [Sinanodonta woodiana]|uniref:Uncharacterized protein n=1 Tax=Sinanodonta woodiana TaxID=1069815 RepID=A0ABD3UWG3_SINWO